MKPEKGSIYEGKITSITNFGAFVSLPDGPDGLVHISEVSNGFVKDINELFTVGQTVKVKVISIAENGKIALSIKQAQPREEKPQQSSPRPRPQNNERKFTPKKVEQKPQFNPNVPPEEYWEEQISSNQGFEDMMNKFKKSSQDKFSDLKRGGESRGYSRRGHGGRK
ncbi:MAG: S1 RNA-binding domain-containing protein [Ruminococcus sp.]|nr:S1 RNA-binding domain-containing protein [Ruminococcus sp.]MDO4420048.1 S1 RNA-binding domain-containing protein [Ruminococcus sp.]